MELSDYTTYADVRASLGVTEQEISDVTLALAIYEDNLKIEMEDVGVDFTADYDALLTTTPSTKAEERMLRVGRLFCTYVVANHLLSSLPLFSPKEVTDGKASFSRYADGPYQETIKQVRARYARYEAAVGEAYAALKTVSAVSRVRPTYMAAAGLATDPITGT